MSSIFFLSFFFKVQFPLLLVFLCLEPQYEETEVKKNLLIFGNFTLFRRQNIDIMGKILCSCDVILYEQIFFFYQGFMGNSPVCTRSTKFLAPINSINI